MQFVELVVSTEQALMTRAALDIVLNDPERYVLTEDERSAYERLAVFFGSAAVDPARFPLSPRQASRIKAIVRKAKGPAQPKSRRNKRKVRQERRIAFAKQRRKNNREFMAEYNEAVEKMAKEREEMEAAYAEVQARVEAEPKFNIVDGVGNLIMAGVPESAIRPQELGPADGVGESLGSDHRTSGVSIILPSELPE